MSKRNISWLVATLVVGVVVGIMVGPWWGVAAAIAVLFGSEVFERRRRTRLRAARGVTEPPSIKDAITVRRKRR